MCMRSEASVSITLYQSPPYFLGQGLNIELVALLLVRVAGSKLQGFFFLMPSPGVTDAYDGHILFFIWVLAI